MPALDNKTVLVIGRGSGLARAVALAARDAGARARGRVAELDRDAPRLSFDTKVIGPLMRAKHWPRG